MVIYKINSVRAVSSKPNERNFAFRSVEKDNLSVFAALRNHHAPLQWSHISIAEED